MLRTGGPEPIRRRLRVVTEPRFALSKIVVRALQSLTHDLEGRHDVVELVLVLWRAPVQAQWRRRPTEIVFSKKPGERGQVSGDEPVGDIEDEQGHQEDRRALSRHDDDRLVEQRAIDVIQRGFDRQNAELLLPAAGRVEEREFAAHHGALLVSTAAHQQRLGAIGRLADFDEADGRQAKNPLDLQLQLSPVQIPQALAEALQIAARDLGHSAVDGPDVPAVVDIELKQREEQRDREAEEEDPGQEAQTNSAAQTIEGAPRRRHPTVAKRGDSTTRPRRVPRVPIR